MQGEISKTNMTNLLLAQQMIQAKPLVARHLLDIDEVEEQFIANLGPSALQRLASCGALLFSFKFSGESLKSLQAFVDGDELALSQAELALVGEEE